MKNQIASAPVVVISEIRTPSTGKHVDVYYTKTIKNPANTNPFTLGFQVKGHPNAVEQKDKTLGVWVRYQDAANFNGLGWNVGDNVNQKSNNPVIVDIVDYDVTELTKNHGLDKEGNVRREPVTNPQTGEFIKSIDGELIFRFVELVHAETLEQLQEVTAQYTRVERMRNAFGVVTFHDLFEGERKREVEGRNVMTPEYQAFIQDMYYTYNTVTLTEITQEALEVADESADKLY